MRRHPTFRYVARISVANIRGFSPAPGDFVTLIRAAGSAMSHCHVRALRPTCRPSIPSGMSVRQLEWTSSNVAMTSANLVTQSEPRPLHCARKSAITRGAIDKSRKC